MASSQWCFADFRLDPANACLWRGTQPVALTPKAFDMLHYLVTHPDRLVTKDTLLDAVWPETAISDVVVRIAIGELRRALGDTVQAPRFIATVHRRGYRFLAPVTEYLEAVPEPARPVLPTMPPLDAPAVPPHAPGAPPPAALLAPEAERRHLTVLFCDLVNSTRLAGHLDPEDLREVVHAYHQICAAVIEQYDGYIAQYLGDGLLVYFGYPVAHEDDAQRAVRAGLGILHALAPRNTRLPLPPGDQLAVRLGIHTGLVVVGDVGAGARHEPLALGETPNITARLQHLAEPNTLVISAATQQLVAGYFRYKALGAHTLPGVGQPLEVYCVLGASGAQSRLEVAATHGLTPLVGRAQEVGLLVECWTRVTEGMGQVVLLGGEAGIGKSRLVQVLKEHVAVEGHLWLECQGSPYYQHTALYPLTELLAWRLLHVEHEATAAQKVHQLEAFVVQHGLSPAETVPLFAPLLSLPLPPAYAPVQVSPEQQRQQTLHALLTLVLCLAAKQPLLLILEDLHWVDPSTLEWLGLLVDQGPTARILALGTCRPDFSPPWTGRSHCTQVTLARLPQRQAAELTHQVAQGKALPAEVVAQIVAKTDGVPLFVEEVTKTVLESGLLQEQEDGYALTRPLPPLAIPATLHDALLARLDRLGAAKGLAQFGAALGREFAYELLQAAAPWDEGTVRRELQQLVEAELLYQRGLPPLATYIFKHALIQDAAYQSLLRSTRQQYHQRIAQVVEARFPEICETQPEQLAHHYTEAGLTEHAISYWQRAGQQARQRSANLEAIQHLTKGLELLTSLPETAAQAQQEIALLIVLGSALVATRGPAAPEVEQTYARARALCEQVGDTSQLFPALRGLWGFYRNRGDLLTARQLGMQLARQAQREAVPTLRLEIYDALGTTLFHLGEYAAAWTHLEPSLALIDPTQPRAQALRNGVDPGVRCLAVAANTLWCLGYPAQAVQRSREALAQAQALAHPESLAVAQHWVAYVHHRYSAVLAVQLQAEALLTLSTAQGLPLYAGYGTCWQGWARAMQGQGEAGIAQIDQGMAAIDAIGQTLSQPLWLVLMAEAMGSAGQVQEGLRILAEALTAFEASGRGDLLAEAYRLQGALLLRQSIPDAAQAEACFQQALTIARRQQAKSWELRAAMSLARLWQSQGKCAEAYELLAPIYGWFTEGFDTADLQEAKALLEALG